MTPPTPQDERTSLCLGLCLGARHVGVALVGREHLVRVRVVELDDDVEARIQRLVGIVRDFLTLYNIRRVAVVTLQKLGAAEPVILGQWSRVAELATEARLCATRYGADEIRSRFLADQPRRSTRALADLLGSRFPELALHAPSARTFRRALSSTRRPVVTPKERYWSRAFLAVAGALHDLDEDLRQRLSPHFSNVCLSPKPST